jgi:hypothetical protein
MPAISKEKKDKISEQILHHLFSISPNAIFTSSISKEIARDEEFTKSILVELEKKKLIVEVAKNRSGISYIRRQRWRLSNQAFEIYLRRQSTPLPLSSQQSLNSDALFE